MSAGRPLLVSISVVILRSLSFFFSCGPFLPFAFLRLLTLLRCIAHEDCFVYGDDRGSESRLSPLSASPYPRSVPHVFIFFFIFCGGG